MLNSVLHLKGSSIAATDGEVGQIEEAYFDDEFWAVRYLVVNTGTWLSGRDVLISPYAVKQPLGSGKIVDVALTRGQVEGSPDIDTHQPVSRRHEQQYLRYYAYPDYWEGGSLWALGAVPLLTQPPWPVGDASEREEFESAQALEDKVPAADVHLRSSAAVTGYDIHATDGSIGHVKDFIFDDESWAIRYLLVDTRNWWPGGKKVLVAIPWVDKIDWAESTVYVNLTREQIKNSPPYEEGSPIQRDYEKRLHDAYSRQGYWD